MAEPVRKMPADREPEPTPSDDPFRYGWRWRRVRLPSGEVTDQQVPLTAEDLLDPQLGDEVTQGGQHFSLLLLLAGMLRRHFEPREDVYVTGDMKMRWGIPGLKEPAPDIAIIPGVRRKPDPEPDSWDVVREGARPCLIIEVVSSKDAETRRNDYEKKVVIYRRAGIPEYLILDPPTSATKGRCLLTGYRLDIAGRYRKIEPNSRDTCCPKPPTSFSEWPRTSGPSW
jgi:Uma2 family endonuclease